MPTPSIDSLRALVAALAAGQIPGTLYDAHTRTAFRELAANARQAAKTLEPLRGRRVLLAAEPSLDFVVTLLACWQANVLPLVLDAWTAARAGSQDASGAAALWQAGQWRALDAHLVSKGAGDGNDDAALVLFTSGSSGQPKGVVLSHAQILANLAAVARAMNLAEPDSVAMMLPLHHSFALITQLLLTLWTGGELHLLPAQGLPGEKLAYLQSHAIHRLAGVPTHFRLLLDDPAVRLPELRHVKVAGAALDAALAARMRGAMPAAELWVGYGLTEAGPRVSALSDRDAQFAAGSAGRALPGVVWRIVAGELQIKSPAMMTGYLDQPEATAAAFDDGWLRTGDTARLAGDYLYILGRSDELFQVAGEKIAPLEIEKALLGCPGVLAAAVYGEPDAMFGSRLVALIQGEVDLPQLRRYARAQLQPEKRPQSWYAVSGLPLTPNGKLRRKELPQWPRQTFTRES